MSIDPKAELLNRLIDAILKAGENDGRLDKIEDALERLAKAMEARVSVEGKLAVAEAQERTEIARTRSRQWGAIVALVGTSGSVGAFLHWLFAWVMHAP